jgi:hypothetical protein
VPIEGRAEGARPGQRIVLFAKSGLWYVRPFTDRPFTAVAPDSTWRNSTHVGTEYSALLVEPEYRPPETLAAIPREGDGIAAVATTEGTPAFWQTAWFRVAYLAAVALAVLAWYRARTRQLARQPPCSCA